MIPLRDTIPSSRPPVVNYLLITVNVAAFLYTVSLGHAAETFIYAHGLIPRDFTFPALLTSMFLHGGWFHLLGNMLYLYIFGDNVEDRLGPGRYLAFYVLCGMVAGCTQAIVAADSSVPMVGASGAIAGVSGAYLLFFPHARVVTLVPIFIFLQVIEIPAVFFLAILVPLAAALGGRDPRCRVGRRRGRVLGARRRLRRRHGPRARAAPAPAAAGGVGRVEPAGPVKLTAGARVRHREPVDTRTRSSRPRLVSSPPRATANTSLSQVAKEAQVSKALIFWHFENKETLFRTALQRTLEPYFINVVDDLEGLAEVDQIKRLVDEYYTFVSRNIYSVKFFLSLLLREEKHPDDLVGHMDELHRVYGNLLADIIDSGRQKGVFRENVNPQLDAGLIMTALHGILVQGFMGQQAAAEAAVLLGHLKASLVDTLRR